MKLRSILFLCASIILTSLFLRLGIWQLQRLGERRAFNAELTARADTPPVNLQSLPSDTAQLHFRRVRLNGTYDFDREFVLTTRSRNGSPGVNIITPLRIQGTDTAVLVNRGWIYSPDGMTADLSRWREPAALSGEGYVETFQKRAGSVRAASVKNALRWMDSLTVSQAFPYPVRPYYVVLIGNAVNPPANVPPRVPVPPLDEGSHQSYAFQWFSFAAISIIGTVLFLRRK